MLSIGPLADGGTDHAAARRAVAALAPRVVEEFAEAILALRELGLTLLLVRAECRHGARHRLHLRHSWRRIAMERAVGDGVAMEELQESIWVGKTMSDRFTGKIAAVTGPQGRSGAPAPVGLAPRARKILVSIATRPA